ncbi:MAG: GPR endopeptidase [Clostridia bacterium]|nr:GPR endopeptidase [Clostridia bacterium]
MYYRTDLAVEARELSKGAAAEIDGVIANTEVKDELSVTTVEIINEKGEAALGKAVGKYITIEVPEIKYSTAAYESACHTLAEEIGKLCDIQSKTLTLVVGLGNEGITPDSLGTKTVSEIMVTHHMKQHAPELFGDNVSSVCAIAPGVMGTTGMETAEVIKSIAANLKPDLVIVIDALAAADFSRIGVTVQLSDAGIQPGAGVGNNRSALSEKELGVPVIAIGVPTVVDARTFMGDGTRADVEPLIVTPRDIDTVIERCTKTLSGGINLALQKNMTLREIEEYVG